MSARRVAALTRPLRLAAVLASLFAIPAAAETVPEGDSLERARRALERAMANPAAPEHEAEAERRALSALKQQLVTVAASILGLEAQLAEAEEVIFRLETEERAAAGVLAERRDDLSRLLSALQRLARRPEVPFPVGSGDANAILHGRILLKAAKLVLEREAHGVASNLRRVASLRNGIANRRGLRDRAVRRLDEERRVLAALVRIRSERQQGLSWTDTNSPGGSGGPARQIESIEELVDRIARARERTRLRPEDMAGVSPAGAGAHDGAADTGTGSPEDSSRVPAAGPVIGRFGEPAENGWTVQGITIRTRPSGQVVAPRSGRVVFAEPFLDYGELLIIDHGGGYHALLAGLERLDARVGDELVSGEPIGLMGSGADTPHRLYIELRRGGRPVDPLPWLTENSDKVGG